MGSKLASATLVVAIVAGVSFVASWNLGLPPAAAIAWKGAGVALLALYAAQRASGLDGWLLAVVLAFGALGDVLLETHGLIVGALAFLAGHLTAVALYLRHRRPLSGAGRLIALAMAPAVALAAFVLPLDRAGAPGVALYALGLGAMAASAWASRFPRRLTALGAWMFVVSDLLIFLRTGRPVADTLWIGLAVWGLYFAGQALICVGVTQALATVSPRRRAPA